jgi:hypothetical protein
MSDDEVIIVSGRWAVGGNFHTAYCLLHTFPLLLVAAHLIVFVQLIEHGADAVHFIECIVEID